MSKQKIPYWATNTNHAAGGEAWSGQPCKVQPAVGVQATGFIPEQRPPAEWMNWLLHTLSCQHHWTSGLQLKNWQHVDVTLLNPTYWDGDNVRQIDYSAAYGVFSAIDSGGYTARCVTAAAAPGGDGVAWESEHGATASTPRDINAPSVVWDSVDLASDHSTGRMAITTETGATTYLYKSTAFGIWTAQTSPVSHPRTIYHDHSGYWGLAGGATGSTDVYLSATGLTGSWTGYSTGESDLIHMLRHSRDANNPCWIAIDSLSHVLCSDDGTSWTHLATLPANVLDLAYDALYQRWIAVLYDAGDLPVYYSDDNGLHWTGPISTGIPAVAYVDVGVSSDHQGGWIINTHSKLFVNRDGGVGTYETVCWYLGETCSHVCFGSVCFAALGATTTAYRSLLT